MGEVTGIEWTNMTFNPWMGCEKVSAGCKNCYMFTLLERWGKDPTMRTRTKDWKKVLRWNEQAGREQQSYESNPMQARFDDGKPARPRVFPSLMDWLDNKVPIKWLADFLDLIRETPNLDWLLLTKRPENFQDRMHHICGSDVDGMAPAFADCWRRGLAPENVWIGVSAEDQKRADERIPLLLKIPGKIRFLSVEPILEKIEFSDVSHRSDCVRQLGKRALEGIHWAIVGGESGKNRRDPGVEPIVDAARQFKDAGIPVFVKQDCALRPGQQGRLSDEIWRYKQYPAL